MASQAQKTITVDPTSPIILIDISMLFYNAYYEAISKFYLANGDIRVAQREMFKEIRSINAPDLTTFKILATQIVRRGDTIDYANIEKNDLFVTLFKTIIERLIKKICTTVSPTPYKYGNALLIKDCRRADNWRAKKFPTYKQQRNARDIVTSHLQFNGKIVEQFWTIVYPKLKYQLGLKLLSLPTMEADDMAYFAKLAIRQQFPTAELIIVTRDYDYLQLVDDNTKIITFDGIDLNARGFGSPQLNLAIKIMTGDASDNISPIFYGCGEKTAQKILDRLYPNNNGDLDKCATDFIQAIDDIANIRPLITSIMTILTDTSSRRGRPVTSSSRIPSADDIYRKLTQNTLIIHMAKRPELYYADFVSKYRFIDYNDALANYEAQAPPAREITHARSRTTRTGRKALSRARTVG